jgi:hypothetical protein
VHRLLFCDSTTPADPHCRECAVAQASACSTVLICRNADADARCNERENTKCQNVRRRRLEPKQQDMLQAVLRIAPARLRCGSANRSLPTTRRHHHPASPARSSVGRGKYTRDLSLALQRSTRRKGPERRQKARRGGGHGNDSSYSDLSPAFPRPFIVFSLLPWHFRPWPCTARRSS